MTAVNMAASVNQSVGSHLEDPGAQSYSNLVFNANARNGFRLQTNGDLDELDGAPTPHTYTNQGIWWDGVGSSSNYEVMVTVNSGTIDGGSVTGSWITISTNLEWYIERTTLGTDTASLTVDIRRIANPGDAIQFTVGLSATRDAI